LKKSIRSQCPFGRLLYYSKSEELKKHKKMSVRITCIKKDNGNHNNPHEAIEYLGWLNEATGESDTCTRLTMVDFIEKKNGIAYVVDRYGNKAYLYVRSSVNGNKFVQTYADKKYSDNLLALMECRG